MDDEDESGVEKEQKVERRRDSRPWKKLMERSAFYTNHSSPLLHFKTMDVQIQIHLVALKKKS